MYPKDARKTLFCCGAEKGREKKGRQKYPASACLKRIAANPLRRSEEPFPLRSNSSSVADNTSSIDPVAAFLFDLCFEHN